MRSPISEEQPVAIPYRGEHLIASLAVPQARFGVVILAADSCCSRQAPARRALAQAVRQAGFATLMVDLLTPAELSDPAAAAALRLETEVLVARFHAAREWVAKRADLATLPLALVGCGGAGAAALCEAAAAPRGLTAVITDCRWVDRAGPALRRVRAPVLFLAEAADLPALRRIGRAIESLQVEHAIATVPGQRTGHDLLARARAVGRNASLWLSGHSPRPPVRARTPDGTIHAHRRGAG